MEGKFYIFFVGDLFPSLNVPRKRDEPFEKKIKKTMTKMKLQPEENFVLKVGFTLLQYTLVTAIKLSTFKVANTLKIKNLFTQRIKLKKKNEEFFCKNY